jgi:alpha-D-xyloside xylohydrolase
VFVPEGAIIPFGPKMEWSDEKPADVINLYVYAGRDAKFQLYEDEGTNYNYEKGKFATIDITYNDKARTVSFDDQKGDFDGMLKARKFNVVYITKDSAKELNLDNPEGKLVEYNGKKTELQL